MPTEHMLLRMTREIPVIVEDHQLYVEVAGVNGDGNPQCHVFTTPGAVRFAEDRWMDGRKVEADDTRHITIRGREYLFDVSARWCNRYPDPPEVFRWHLDHQAYAKYRHGTSAASSKAQHVLDKLAIKAVEQLHKEMPDLLDWCYWFNAQGDITRETAKIQEYFSKAAEAAKRIEELKQVPQPPANDLLPKGQE